MKRMLRVLATAVGTALCLLAAACGSAARYFPDAAAMREFEAAGPVVPELDRDALMRQLPVPGPYRLGPGDLLEIRGPRALFATGDDERPPVDGVHLARVAGDGTIEVPLAGSIQAGARTLLEVEAAIAAALHPKYLTARPSIVARIVEYDRVPVPVLGAVESPGIQELRRDQLTLFGALSSAGGILKSNNLVVGARRIRVRHQGDAAPADVVLPVKGLNVPFSDVPLRPGDTVEVERYEPDTFTVVGLVNKPGAYEYPPEVTYNLMQGLAQAGGLDLIADPPYATVFRKDQDGRIVPATFSIHGDGLVEASALRIKPGDVIVVEHTPASWTRSLFAQILRIQFGFFVDQRGGN